MKKLCISIELILLLMCISSCDSGDIYPEEYVYDSGVTVTATFSLAGVEAFPRNYTLLFGAFEEGKATPVAFVELQKPAGDDPVEVYIDNIPEKVTTIKLCLANTVRYPVYTFYQKDIAIQDGNIQIEKTDINLLEYGRIQNLFDNNCIACHGSERGAGSLSLVKGKSYDEIMKKSHKNPEIDRIKPYQVEESFLITVLTDETSVSTPHKSKIPNADDLLLLKEWILAGASRN